VAFLASPLITWLAVAGLVAASYGAAYWKGRQDGWDRRDEVAASKEREAERLAARLAQVRQKITEKVVTVYRTKVDVIEREKEVIREIFVPDTCDLSSEWVRRHDLSAGLPDTTPRAYAAAQAIETVGDNYLECRINAKRLTALQDWVSKQAEAK
jgi:hypothetical protein